ncbi:MAG TPA: SMC family ATPase [Anaerolineae bacterium]
MIPLKLELTNFLSYRDTAVLEFDGIHLACISGANGAGKSSILDAITWTLFGQSRSRSDDDLVNRLAALEDKAAEVCFTFALEGSIYRVTRRKKLRSATTLEFQIATDSTNGANQWKTLSEGRLRETQAAVESLLRMNYDTFINASFLLQGKADEFTTKTPNRRKEILADLLGVSLWDRYKEAAATQRKDEESRLLLLDGQLADIDRELTEEPERQAALAEARQAFDLIAGRLADKEALLDQLRRAEAAVKQQKQMIKNLADSLARARQRLVAAQQTRQQRQRQHDEHHAVLAQAEHITADFSAWQDADAALHSWQTKADAYNRLQQAKRPHELAVTQARTRLEQQQQALEGQAQRIAAARSERETVTRSLQGCQQRWRELAANLTNLVRQEQAWQEARAELQRLQGERELQLKELNQLQVQARRLDAMRAEQTAVRDNAQEARSLLDKVTAEIAALNDRHQRYASARAEMDNLEAEQPRLREQMTKIKDRLDRLEAETGGECPLCGQSLSQAHRAAVLAELQSEGRELGERFRHNRQRLEALGAEIAQLQKSLQQSPRLERDQQTQQQRLAQAEARLAEIEQAIATWETGDRQRLDELERALADDSELQAQQQRVHELAGAAREKTRLEQEQNEQQRRLSAAEARLTEIDRAIGEWEQAGEEELAAVKKRLANGDYAVEAQAALRDLEAEVAKLAYDGQAHEKARQARDTLAQAPARHQALKQAEAAVRPLEDALADLDRQISEHEQSVAELAQQHETATADLQQLVAGGGDLRAVEDEVFRLREEVALANRRVGAAQQRLAVLDDLRARHEQLTAKRTELSQRIQRLKLLEKACGRDGVQALLIEQALPDIEERANELLERLTGGDMRVTFETQRQLKSRDALAETLDIHIVDGAGERPYDNYSGGEQFRVNFAIRLALSQVLARRAGARLQTLVIDEGFGSQDPSGRQRLVEAINTIQDDFARILVITHIDELRDAFPTRIEVEKTAAGSTVAVS